MAMKSTQHYYRKPTPAKWRKLGDALLAVSTTIATYAIADGWEKWVQMSALLLGVVGKFLTNFFTEDIQEAPIQEETPCDCIQPCNCNQPESK